MLKNSQIKSTFFAVTATFFVGTFGIWSKLLAGTFDEFTQAWTRSAMILLILVPIGLVFKAFKEAKTKDIKWFAVVSFAASFEVVLFFYGFKHLPVSTAILVFYSAVTIGAYLLGSAFFKDQISFVKIFALLVGISGLGVIFPLILAKSVIIPALSCILAGVCSSTGMVFTKKLSDKYSPIQITTVLYLGVFVVNLSIAMFLQGFNFTLPVTASAWGLQSLYTLFALLGFCFIVLGYKNLEPSIAGLIGLLEVPLSIFYGVLVFGELITRPVLIGEALILIAAALPNLVGLIRLRGFESKS